MPGVNVEKGYLYQSKPGRARRVAKRLEGGAAVNGPKNRSEKVNVREGG